MLQTYGTHNGWRDPCRSLTSSTLLVYNLCNRLYYKLASCRINLHQLPGSVHPTLHYDGCIFCSLLWDDNPPFKEKYPLGTWVERVDPTINMLLAGKVMDISFPLDSSGEASIPNYTVLFNNGSLTFIPLKQMAGIIRSLPISPHDSETAASLLPPFLRLNSKITFEHEGQNHKGYLGFRDGVYCFVYKTHVNKRKEDWSVPLPDLPTTWVDLCVEEVLLPSYISHTVCQSPVSPQLGGPAIKF